MAVPTAFRLIVGVLFIYFAYTNLNKNRDTKLALFGKYGFPSGAFSLWLLNAIETLGGLLLIIGLFTQITSVALSVLLISGLYSKQKYPDLIPWSKGFMVLLIFITISLLFLGPGFFSIDLPF